MKTMKNLVMMMLMSILTAGMVSVFTACNDDLDLPVGGEEEGMEFENWTNPVSFRATCDKPVLYMNNAGNVPGELQLAIEMCFPRKVGSLDEAEIAFIDAATAVKEKRSIREFCERGGLMVCLFPN